MKRPVLVAIIGYIIGIIVGIYLNKSIFLFYIPIIATYLIYKIFNKQNYTSFSKLKENKYSNVNKKTNYNKTANDYKKTNYNKIANNYKIISYKKAVNNYKITNYNKIAKAHRKKLKLFSFKRYFRYVKIFINSKMIFLIILSSIISNSIVILQNKQYEKIYEELSKSENTRFTGIIVSSKEEKKYYNRYKVKCKIYNNQNYESWQNINNNDKKDNANNQKNRKSIIKKPKYKTINLYITISKKKNLEYGEKIIFTGTYQKPEEQRNYKGFDYSEYLKQLKIYGTVKVTNFEVLEKNKANKILQISNIVSERIIEGTKKTLDKESSAILLGLMLGYKKDVSEDIQENFRNASMSHILAVSGMHISYIILGINLIFKKILGKKYTYILSIFILIFYMFITNFSPSITRAGIMGILYLISKIIYRKNDIYTSMAISLWAILTYNPFLIQNIGLQLSYGGILGIVVLNNSVLKFLKNINVKNKTYKYFIRPKIKKQLDKIKEIISVSISVQIFIFPILILNMNKFNLYFLLSGLILSIVIGPIVIIGFLFILFVLIKTGAEGSISFLLLNLFKIIIKISAKILIGISNIGKLPFSKIYISTISLFLIIIYYLIISVIFAIYSIYSAKNLTWTQIRVKNLIAIGKMKLRNNKKHIKKIVATILIIIFVIIKIPKNLKIYFVDVGQGDSTFIVTPYNQTILIDGGGGSKDYNVGKNTLLPYILDRGYSSIDFIIISHFDDDHVRRTIIFDG